MNVLELLATLESDNCVNGFNLFFLEDNKDYDVEFTIGCGILDGDDGLWDSYATLHDAGVTIIGNMGCNGYGDQYAIDYDWKGTQLGWKLVRKNEYRPVSEEATKKYEAMIGSFVLDGFEFNAPKSREHEINIKLGDDIAKCINFN